MTESKQWSLKPTHGTVVRRKVIRFSLKEKSLYRSMLNLGCGVDVRTCLSLYISAHFEKCWHRALEETASCSYCVPHIHPDARQFEVAQIYTHVLITGISSVHVCVPSCLPRLVCI
jgi:hypothetical protein